MESINSANITGEKLQEFIKCVSLLSDVEFLGVAKILCVDYTGVDKKPRPVEAILSDMIDKFVFLKRKKRRELMKILKQITLYSTVGMVVYKFYIHLGKHYMMKSVG